MPNYATEVVERAEGAFSDNNYSKALNLFKEALVDLDKDAGSYHAEKRKSEVLLRIVDTLDKSGKWFDALMYVDTIINIARMKDDRVLEITSHLRAVRILMNRGSWKEVLNRIRKMDRLLNKHGTPHDRGEGFYGLAYAEWRLGDNEQAKVKAQHALVLAREHDEKGLEGESLILLGLILKDTGHLDKAISHFQEAIVVLEEIGDLTDLARAYNDLGEVYKTQGNYATASTQYQRCVETARESGNERVESYGLTNAAECMAREDRIEEAKQTLERAMNTMDLKEDEYALANIDYVRGIIAYKEQNMTDMDKWYRSALEKMEKLETPYDLGIFSYDYALNLKQLGRLDEAESMLDKARSAFKDANATIDLEKVNSVQNELKD